MSMLGLSEIGITAPRGTDRGNVIVFVEMDRRATDAVQSVTGCSLGQRTLKVQDYGKMAATFLNLKTGKANRVIAKEKSRQKATEMFPKIEDEYSAQSAANKFMADSDLFDVMAVKIELRREDMPGRPLRRVKCDSCAEYIQDMREIYSGEEISCRPCAETGYYTPLTDVIF